METRTNGGRAELITFLVLTFASSAVFWWLIVDAGTLGAHGGLYVLALMWCPGVSALITRLVFQRNLRGEGWALGAPRWLALAVVLAWFRLRSGSVWPAAIVHASHNLYVQGFFDRVTVDTGPTPWLTSEFGAALAVTIGITAWIFWRARGALTGADAQVAARDPAIATTGA